MNFIKAQDKDIEIIIYIVHLTIRETYPKYPYKSNYLED